MTKPRIPWPKPPNRTEAAVRERERTTSQWLRFGECDRARKMRATVQGWLGTVDDAEFADAVRGLGEGDDAVVCQNFSELVVGAWLRGQGLNYNRHPVASNKKRPDFGVQIDGQTFYVEVVTSTGYPRASKPPRTNVVDQEASASTDRFRQRLVTTLESRLARLGPSRLVLSLCVEGTVRLDPKPQRIVDQLVRWVQEGAPSRPRWENDEEPELVRQIEVELPGEFARVTLEVAYEQSVAAEGLVLSLSGWQPTMAQALLPVEPEQVLRNAVSAKLTRYGTDVPLIVVLCVPNGIELVRWPEDPMLALYGRRYGKPLIDRGRLMHTVSGQSIDGLWTQATRHPHVCGVLVVGDMCPRRFERVQALWSPNLSYHGPPVPNLFGAAGQVFIEETTGEPVYVPASAGAFWSACVGSEPGVPS